METKEVKVIIPVYHAQLTVCEMISLTQCKRILNHYPLCIIKPDTMFLEKEVIQGMEIEEFDAEWFQSVQTYNQLMLTEQFYERFNDYKYILIYQLDAFVFRDELHVFCSMEYDYIGAPWIYGRVFYINGMGGYYYTGNGGFSLRKVGACLEALRKNRIEDAIIEDVFFSTRASDQFRIAPVDIALKFSFEEHVRECFKRNHQELPFGCHGWQKFDFAFYRQTFQHYGYDTSAIQDGKLDQTLDSACDCSELTEGSVRKALKSLLTGMGDKVWIWGAGQIGIRCGWLFEKHHIEIKGYIDSNVQVQGTYLYGKRIENVSEYFTDVSNTPVIVAMKHMPEGITRQLNQSEKKEGRDYTSWELLIRLLIS